MQDNVKWAAVLGVCCIVLIVAIVGALTRDRETVEEARERRPPTVRPQNPRPVGTRADEFENVAPPPPTDPHASTRASIADLRERINADPESPEAGGWWQAKGNLYTRLGEFGHAARCYEHFLRWHEDSPLRLQVYPELVTAYERAGDRENRVRILLEMLEVFPERTEQHLWARVELGLEYWDKELGRHPRVYPPEDDIEGETENDNALHDNGDNEDE